MRRLRQAVSFGCLQGAGGLLPAIVRAALLPSSQLSAYPHRWLPVTSLPALSPGPQLLLWPLTQPDPLATEAAMVAFDKKGYEGWKKVGGG